MNLVKVKLDGDLRIMEVPAPPQFSSLEKAVAEAYALNELGGITFTYNDSDGDQVQFFGSLNNPVHAVLMSSEQEGRNGLPHLSISVCYMDMMFGSCPPTT